MLGLRWEIEKNNNNVVFEIQLYDSLTEVFTSIQLPAIFW